VSQPDLTVQLRRARPLVPAELRELVAGIAAQAEASPHRRSRSRRHVLLGAVAIAAVAAIGAAVLLPVSRQGASLRGAQPERAVPYAPAATPALAAGATDLHKTATASSAAAVPAVSPNRTERITTSLELRVANTQDVSDGTKQAVRIARALGGYPSSLNVNSARSTGYADIVLRIPKRNVQAAVSRLSALGTIIGENVSIKDIQARVDATARKIARLEAKLAAWQQQPQTSETQSHIAGLTDQIGKLKRGRAATIRAAGYATVSVELTTRPAPPAAHHGHGPLHGLAVAFRWAGIGAIYVLALGTPLLILCGLVWLAARAVRRHRENELLSRS
jgi:Domain of unknown function (DUF4349)